MRRRIAVGEDDASVARNEGDDRDECLEALVDRLFVGKTRGRGRHCGFGIGNEADDGVLNRLAVLIGDLSRKGGRGGRLARGNQHHDQSAG